MRQFSLCITLLVLLGCWEENKTEFKLGEVSSSAYDTFDKPNHLLPNLDKGKFDTTHGWQLGWTLLEPINIANGEEEEELLSRRLSPGQKALYFIWYLDAEVTNGGFIQFYWNGYRKYLQPIREGLKLIKDTSMLTLVEAADKEYVTQKDAFDTQRKEEDWSPLYDKLGNFKVHDSIYFAMHDSTMALMENYIRKQPNEFAKLHQYYVSREAHNMAFAKWLHRHVNHLPLVMYLHIFNWREGMQFQPLRKRLNRWQ